MHSIFKAIKPSGSNADLKKILQEKLACLLTLLHIDRESKAKGIIVCMVIYILYGKYDCKYDHVSRPTWIINSSMILKQDMMQKQGEIGTISNTHL